MKRIWTATLSTCLAALLLFYVYYHWIDPPPIREKVRVGFVYDNDESTSYTYNFSLARDELKKKYGDRVEILTRSNILEDETAEPLQELVSKGCDIIFLNGYSPQVMEVAEKYPKVQFCQASWMDMNGQTVPTNYHSFKGEAYQARYVSGIAAGMALRQMLDRKEISAEEALVGYVAAFENPEVVSGYTAFLMGIRSVAPEATMKVGYTHTWSNYAVEKRIARKLLDEGCIVISQHTDTIGPVLACEEMAQKRTVYHVAYNQGLQEIAPRSALIAARVNWAPYVTGAVEAVFNDKPIERMVKGNVHGTDMSAGFEQGWVEVMDLNIMLAAPGTEEKMNEAIAQFRRGNKSFAYRTDARAVGIQNVKAMIDLRNGFTENATSSYPSFYYLLPDLITVE